MILLRLITTRKVQGVGLDPDAQSFITAAGIIDATQKSAINQLVLDLKGYSIWTKMEAIYPMVGGTSSSTSYNLKNTAQYQIIWSNSPVFANTGVTTNGSSHGNTQIAGTNFTLGDMHVSLYTRSSSTDGFGIGDTTDYSDTAGLSVNFSGTCYGAIHEYIKGFATATTTGMVCATRASGPLNVSKNGVVGLTDSNAPTSRSSVPIKIGLLGTGGVNAFSVSSMETAFATIGTGLTNTEVLNLYTAVQAYQTTLGRQV